MSVELEEQRRDVEDCLRAGVVPEYVRLMEAGNDSRFASMLALRRPPGTGGTDRAFQAGCTGNHNLGNLPEFLRRRVVNTAKAAGICVGGRVYMPSLADKRGAADPMAWIADGSELLEACRAKNRDCDFGAGNKQVVRGPPPEDVPLAEDLVQENMQEYLMRDPGRAKNLPELREEIIEKHGAPAAKKHGDKIKRERQRVKQETGK